MTPALLLMLMGAAGLLMVAAWALSALAHWLTVRTLDWYDNGKGR